MAIEYTRHNLFLSNQQSDRQKQKAGSCLLLQPIATSFTAEAYDDTINRNAIASQSFRRSLTRSRQWIRTYIIGSLFLAIGEAWGLRI